jgi:hypothetical protein
METFKDGPTNFEDERSGRPLAVFYLKIKGKISLCIRDNWRMGTAEIIPEMSISYVKKRWKNNLSPNNKYSIPM